MKHLMQMVATFTLAAALAASGNAQPGNGNGGNGNGKGNKPNQEQKGNKGGNGNKPEKGNKGGNGNAADKQAEKEARKAEREAAKAEREAAKAAAKAERDAAKEAAREAREAAKAAKKASKGTTTALSLGQIIITDSRVLDLSGDYTLSSTLVLEEETTETSAVLSTTIVDLSIVQDERGELVGTALITLEDGSTTEVAVVGELSVDGGELSVSLSGEYEDENSTETASITIDGVWDGTAFISEVVVSYNEEVITFEAEIVPVNEVVGIIIEPALDAHVIGNKIWGTREVVLPWGNTVVRSQQMNKKGLKFMMHSGEFGIDLRGAVDENGVVDLSRAHLHLGYGTFFIDPATVTILPAVQ